MESREDQLERCLRRLLECTELNLDEMKDETRAAIRQALMIAESESTAPQTEELVNTVLYIGEQVELIRIALDQLCNEVAGMKKAMAGKGQDRQGRLWSDDPQPMYPT